VNTAEVERQQRAQAVDRWQRELAARDYAVAYLREKLAAGEIGPGVYEVTVCEETITEP
jgi:hypothetical protein